MNSLKVYLPFLQINGKLSDEGANIEKTGAAIIKNISDMKQQSSVERSSRNPVEELGKDAAVEAGTRQEPAVPQEPEEPGEQKEQEELEKWEEQEELEKPEQQQNLEKEPEEQDEGEEEQKPDEPKKQDQTGPEKALERDRKHDSHGREKTEAKGLQDKKQGGGKVKEEKPAKVIIN